MLNRALSEWTPDCGREPHIRVGIVLPTDATRALRIDVPAGGAAVQVAAHETVHMDAGTWWLRVDGDRVGCVAEHLSCASVGAKPQAAGSLHAAATTLIAGRVVRLAMTPTPAEVAGAGVRVHDVLTGRGFHWQKRVDYTLIGSIEASVIDGCLLLVNELPVEQYLQGVITAEMSGECPLEFLKSQCIVARSWVLAHTEPKHTAWPIDRCNDDCCQRFHGTTHLAARAVQAVVATRGQVVTDASGRIIDANYSKNCGGIIEAPEFVWFTTKSCQRSAVDAPAGSSARRFLPINADNLDEFLTGGWLASTDVFCSPNVVPESDLPRYLGSVDDGGGHFRWQVEYTREQLEDLLRRKLGHAFDAETEDPPEPGRPVLVADLPPTVTTARVPPMKRLCDLRVLQRGASGRASQLEIVYEDAAGRSWNLLVRSEYRIREVLHERFLYSSAFQLEVPRGSDDRLISVRLIGAGWGHGAGLCQIGALGMALRGYSSADILRHYFANVTVRELYS